MSSSAAIERTPASTQAPSVPASSSLQPPVSVELLINGVTPSRYIRKGSNENADTAIVGKGGFGTAYLYERDPAFTPDSSCDVSAPFADRPSPDQSPVSMGEPTLEGISEEYREGTEVEAETGTGVVEAGPSKPFRGGTVRSASSSGASNSRSVDVHDPNSTCLQPAGPASSRTSYFRRPGLSPSGRQRFSSAKGKGAPSAVVVKLCRTPCTGSFDELQKTSVVERRKRKAMMQDPGQSHVRVVRGEGRIFRYLQAAQETVDPNGTEVHLVRLLANLPIHGRISARAAQTVEEDSPLPVLDVEPDSSDGPPARVLVFERLVEIDCIRTARGWEKSKAPWPVAKVERMALETIQGLKFLHQHNVTHGDIKPSNLMIDVHTGSVKIIDLGASRRFVEVPNYLKDCTDAVDQGDIELLKQGKARPTLLSEHCEGLSSLTGSPHYMAPEILLQASRYADKSGRARSVLEDYEVHYTTCFGHTERAYYETALNDLKRGWGIKADIWSWSCTVSSLFLRTQEAKTRPSSSTICPFDFSFSKHQEDYIDALHTQSAEEQDQPRFHLWSRHFPLYIVGRTLQGIDLPPVSKCASATLQAMMRAALSHQDQRPTAAAICRVLSANRGGAEGSQTMLLDEPMLDTSAANTSPASGPSAFASLVPDSQPSPPSRPSTSASLPLGPIERGGGSSPHDLLRQKWRRSYLFGGADAGKGSVYPLAASETLASQIDTQTSGSINARDSSSHSPSSTPQLGESWLTASPNIACQSLELGSSYQGSSVTCAQSELHICPKVSDGSGEKPLWVSSVSDPVSRPEENTRQLCKSNTDLPAEAWKVTGRRHPAESQSEHVPKQQQPPRQEQQRQQHQQHSRMLPSPRGGEGKQARTILAEAEAEMEAMDRAAKMYWMSIAEPMEIINDEPAQYLSGEEAIGTLVQERPRSRSFSKLSDSLRAGVPRPSVGVSYTAGVSDSPRRVQEPDWTPRRMGSSEYEPLDHRGASSVGGSGSWRYTASHRPSGYDDRVEMTNDELTSSSTHQTSVDQFGLPLIRGIYRTSSSVEASGKPKRGLSKLLKWATSSRNLAAATPSAARRR